MKCKLCGGVIYETCACYTKPTPPAPESDNFNELLLETINNSATPPADAARECNSGPERCRACPPDHSGVRPTHGEPTPPPDAVREWWLYQDMRSGSIHFSDEPKQESEYLRFIRSVVERSAYESKVRELAALNEFAKGFDAELEQYTETNRLLSSALSEERARSAKLIAALKDAEYQCMIRGDEAGKAKAREAIAEYEGEK